MTVPAGGLGTISETTVGAPRVGRNAVSVPLKCSAQAAGSCTLRLRLTVLETLRGNRVVALARRTRRVTVTVGSRTVRLRPGQQRPRRSALNATGRQLLARVRRLPVRLLGQRHRRRRDQRVAAQRDAHANGLAGRSGRARSHRHTASHSRRQRAPSAHAPSGRSRSCAHRPARVVPASGRASAGAQGRRSDARERPRADAVHGLGHLLHLRRALRRGLGAGAGQPAPDARARAPGLPLRLAGRRLVAGSAQRNRRRSRSTRRSGRTGWRG